MLDLSFARLIVVVRTAFEWLWSLLSIAAVAVSSNHVQVQAFQFKLSLCKQTKGNVFIASSLTIYFHDEYNSRARPACIIFSLHPFRPFVGPFYFISFYLIPNTWALSWDESLLMLLHNLSRKLRFTFMANQHTHTHLKVLIKTLLYFIR